MISPILPIHAADAVTLDFGVFVAEQARTHRVSQTAIIAALLPSITPLQPGETSRSHAPAAETPASQAAGDKTDGEASPKPSSPSVEPIPEAPKPLPDAPDTPADALSQPAEAKTSGPAGGESPSPDGGAVSAVKGANARLENAEGAEPPPSTLSMVGRLKALFANGQQPTNKEAVQALGLKNPGVAATLAKRAGVTFRKLSKEEFAASVVAGMQRNANAQKAKVAEKAEVLRTSLPSDRLCPPPELDATDVLHRVRKPSGIRFYLRDRAGRYVHQSLDAAPTGGPLMTDKRVYAWFGTMAQFTAASKKWPELADMRQAGPDQ